MIFVLFFLIIGAIIVKYTGMDIDPQGSEGKVVSSDYIYMHGTRVFKLEHMMSKAGVPVRFLVQLQISSFPVNYIWFC
jgi:hypothetical protein